MLGGGLRLVQPLQRTVVAFVEAPRLVDGNPEQIHFIERDPERANRALEDGRMRHVELELLGGHQPSRLARFGAPFLVQVDVGPAGEAILLIPGAFAVTEQHESIHRILWSA